MRKRKGDLVGVMWRLAIFLMCPCSCSSAPVLDAAMPEPDASVVIAAPMPPALPAPPAWTCPTGWRATMPAPGVSSCDPWPESGHMHCDAIDEAHFPGTPGCARIGPACPTDGWPADLPASGVTYVRASAAPGGDGSRDAPYASLSDALATPATLIALATGDYQGLITIPAGVTVRGACISGTRITSTSNDIENSSLVVLGGTLSDVQLDSQITAVSVDAFAKDARMSEVVIVSSSWFGIYAGTMGMLTADHIAIRNVGVYFDSSAALAFDRASFTISNLVVEGALVGAYLNASDGEQPQLSLTDAVLVGEDGFGLAALGAQAEIHLERSAVTGYAQLLHTQDGAAISASEIALYQNAVAPGIGAAIAGTGRFTLDRAAITSITGSGVDLLNGSLTANDLVMVDVVPDPGTALGVGILGRDNTDLALTRIVLARSTTFGIWSAGSNARAELNDVQVTLLETPQPVLRCGGALIAGESSFVTGARILLDFNSCVSLAAAGGVLELTDVSITDGRELSMTNTGAFGLLSDRGSVTLERARFEQMGERAIEIENTSNVTLTDVLVRGTRPLATGAAGYGLIASGDDADTPVRVRLDRVSIEHSGELGFLAGPYANVTGSDVSVSDTQMASCTDCPEGTGGSGIMVLGATLELDRFVSTGNALAGLHLGVAPTFTLRNGVVSANRYGLATVETQPSYAGIDATVTFSGNTYPDLTAAPYVPPMPTRPDLTPPP